MNQKKPDESDATLNRSKIVEHMVADFGPTLADAHSAAQTFCDALIATNDPYYSPVVVIDRLDQLSAGIYVGNRPLPLPLPAKAILSNYVSTTWVQGPI